MSPEELVEEIVAATVQQQDAIAEAAQARARRAVAIWQLRQSTGWAASKIARKAQQALQARGVTELDGIGVSHDNVRRVVEGPEPVA